MMLSRVADNLYWMRRYLERAEHTARLIDVNLDLTPDRTSEAVHRAWDKVFSGLHLDRPKGANAYQITDFLTFDASNPGSIISLIASARENARQVRELISSEMWEYLNRLYLTVRQTELDKIWNEQPHAFFQTVKEGTHLFQGISDSTMNHGEGWHFIQVGLYIERAFNVTALLNTHLHDIEAHANPASASDAYLDWVSILRCCTAFEAYCKVYTADLRFDRLAEFLLLNAGFPHSVHFSVDQMRNALLTIGSMTETRKNSQIYRRVGRLCATLDFDQIDEVISGDLHAYLNHIQQQCSYIHAALYQTYITYSTDAKLAV